MLNELAPNLCRFAHTHAELWTVSGVQFYQPGGAHNLEASPTLPVALGTAESMSAPALESRDHAFSNLCALICRCMCRLVSTQHLSTPELPYFPAIWEGLQEDWP